MKQVVATVVSNERLWGEYWTHGYRKYLGAWRIELKSPEVASVSIPGQFVMVNCGRECILPRPFSIHQVNGNSIVLFFAVLEQGKGTNWLSQCKTDDKLNIFGPLGNGFYINNTSEKLLLVAGGNGIAPLYLLAQEALKSKYRVTLLYGTANNHRYQIPLDVEIISATEDGTVGYHGLVTDLLPDYINRSDQIFACGPIGMYRNMAQMPELSNKPVQVSLEVRMGCGRGVCYGCTIKTRNGLKRVCEDGPVFDLDDVLWDELDY